MTLRLKLYLTFLGIVVSIASLGYVGLEYLSETRRAEADLRQLNGQRILLNRLWSDLEAALTLTERVAATADLEERQALRSSVNDVLRSLDDLKSSGLNNESREWVLALRAQIVNSWRWLSRDAEQASGQEEAPDQGSRRSAMDIRMHQQALSRFFDEEFVQANLATSKRLRLAYMWFFAAVVVGVLLSGGLAYLLHRMLLEPLKELEEAADQIRSGKRQITFRMSGDDEFAKVKEVFVAMGRELDIQFSAEKKLRAELDATNQRLERERTDFEKLVEVGKIISSSLEWPKVLRLLTSRANDMVPCMRCSVVEPDKTDQDRAWILSTKLQDRGAPIRIDLKRYPEIRTVLASRQTVQIDDAWQDPQFQAHRIELVHARARSMLVVPMVRQGNLLGVLSFVRSESRGEAYSPWERRVAENIAGIGAVCMENARLYTTLSDSRTEVEQLNRSLRESLDELRETRDRLVGSERMAAIGEMAASVAHSLKNPLAAIRATAQMAAAESSQEEMADIVRLVDRMECHLVQILDFSRSGKEYRKQVNADTVVREVVDQLQRRIEKEGKEIHIEMDESDRILTVLANPERFERAVLAVIENALDACPFGAPIAVKTIRDGGDVCIEVSDKGQGIAADALPRVFDPFFTTKADGTGLGTTIARKVARSMGGSVDIFSENGEGTRVVIKIPGATA